jgi:hypothetical protein
MASELGVIEERVHLLLVDQLAGIGHRLGAVAGVVEHDVLDGVPRHILRQQRDGVALRPRERGAGAGDAEDDPDLDRRGLRGRRRQGREAEAGHGQQGGDGTERHC